MYAAFLCAALELSGSAYAFKSNDFTSANRTVANKYFNAKTRDASTRMARDASKAVDMPAYTPDGNTAKGLENMRANLGNGAGAEALGESVNYMSGKTANMPAYVPQNLSWRNTSDTSANLENLSRYLNKDYNGRTDFDKKNVFNEDFLKKSYSEMGELSMQDINKYQFRHSHSSDPGIKTSEAGGALFESQKSSSVLDFVHGNETVDRPAVDFIGPKKKPRIPSENSAQDTSAASVPQVADYSAAAKTVQKPAPQAPALSPDVSPRRVLKAQSDVEDSSMETFMMMKKIPKELRGRATIKVEVDDDGDDF